MIFKFSKPKPKSKKKPEYRSSTLFPVLTAEELLVGAKQRLVLEKTRAAIDLPDRYYQIICHKLIQHFAEFVQVLPTRKNGKLAQMLNDGLCRALLAAQICKEEEKDALFSYAVFTVALMRDLGKVVVNQVIILSDKKGQFVDEWFPVFGSMVNQGEFYKMRHIHGDRVTLEHYVTPLLARNLLSDLGLRWLASKHDIFEMWLAALNHDDRGAWAIKPILDLIEERLPYLLEELDFELFEILKTEPEETEAGEAFLDWFINGLKDESIEVNKADARVHVVDEGVLLEYPAVFKLFSETYPKYRDWTVVHQQYNELGLAKLSGYDYKFEQFFSTYPGADERLGTVEAKHFLGDKRKKGEARVKKGVIIANKGIVFPNRDIPCIDKNLKSSATRKSSVTVLQNLDKSSVTKNARMTLKK